MLYNHPITNWLQRTNNFWFAFYAAGVAFSLYTCVYILRKTFSVATFEGLYFLDISYKVWLVMFQVIGYALSKFVGIKVIAELKSNSRARGIFWMTLIAGISWLLFAITPPPYNIIFLFTNGLPLGLIWGMIFSYLEGRKTTEVLGAGLSISFIFSSGLAKSIGAYIMLYWNTSEYWMPFVATCLCFGPLLLFLWLLDRIPPPDADDIILRTKRQPMSGYERKKFIATFFPGIVLFILAYMLLTAFRDLRDNFSAEVWKSLGFGDSPSIFARTEVPVSLFVLIVMGSLMFIKKNIHALLINHLIIIIGILSIGISTFMFEHRIIQAEVWMICTGLGLYLGYVPFNSIFFDRLIAAFNYVGTVGFMIYLADSFGYLGSIAILFFKEFGYTQISWLVFFINAGYILSFIGSLLMIASLIYFYQKHRHHTLLQTSDSQANAASLSIAEPIKKV